MNANEVISAIEEEQKRETPLEIAVGDTVRVSAKIREGEKERIQVFEGVDQSRDQCMICRTSG